MKSPGHVAFDGYEAKRLAICPHLTPRMWASLTEGERECWEAAANALCGA